jgi:hypothetical protein
MDTHISELIAIGKEAFEGTSEVGAFFFPTLVICRLNGDTEIVQYQGGIDVMQVALAQVAQEPIEWIGHTADTWYYDTTVSDPLIPDIDAGVTTIEEQFDLGNPKALEAVGVLEVSLDYAVGAFLPYKRTAHGIEWMETVGEKAEGPQVGRVVAAMKTAIRASHSILQ